MSQYTTLTEELRVANQRFVDGGELAVWNRSMGFASGGVTVHPLSDTPFTRKREMITDEACPSTKNDPVSV